MNQTEAIDFMFNLFVEENKLIAQSNGMTEADFQAKMSESEQSLKYMFRNVYIKMKEANLVV